MQWLLLLLLLLNLLGIVNLHRLLRMTSKLVFEPFAHKLVEIDGKLDAILKTDKR